MKITRTNKSPPLPTKLSEHEIERVRAAVVRHLKRYDCIKNSELRKLTGIGYDQAIFFFNKMLELRVLTKFGTGAGTRYILAASSKGKKAT